MSTRSCVQFVQGKNKIQFYVHSDGYPNGRLPDIGKFLKWNVHRNDDITYTTANYVLWTKLDSVVNGYDKESIDKLFASTEETNLHRGIGCVAPTKPNEAGDWIEWFYIIDLNKKVVKCYECGTKTARLVYTISFIDGYNRLINFVENESEDE